MMTESKTLTRNVQNEKELNDAERQSCCRRCRAPIPKTSDFPEYCDDCYSIYGSCCAEFESDE